MAGMTRPRLIVDAEDLGRPPGVNAGIAATHRDGIVGSATLMVNYPAASELPALADAKPRLGIGLHVQLTGGPPLLPASRLRSLVGVVDDELRSTGSYALPRARELAALTSAAVREAVHARGIELVGFAAL
jgi:predicted glycoside hydrolase/deacetylase ChbG (UPF0249 family)